MILAGAASALAAGPGHFDLYPVALLDVVAACCGIAFLPASAFMRVFIFLFWGEAALFSLASVAAEMGRWPAALAALTPPASLPISADVFCLLALALAYVPAIRRVTAIGDLYLLSASRVSIPFSWWPMTIAEGRLAGATIAFLVCLRQGELLVGILSTFATRSFFDAMQALEVDRGDHDPSDGSLEVACLPIVKVAWQLRSRDDRGRLEARRREPAVVLGNKLDISPLQ